MISIHQLAQGFQIIHNLLFPFPLLLPRLVSLFVSIISRIRGTMVTPSRAGAKVTIATKTKHRRFSRARGIRAVLGEETSEKSRGIFSKLFHEHRIVRSPCQSQAAIGIAVGALNAPS